MNRTDGVGDSTKSDSCIEVMPLTSSFRSVRNRMLSQANIHHYAIQCMCLYAATALSFGPLFMRNTASISAQ